MDFKRSKLIAVGFIASCLIVIVGIIEGDKTFVLDNISPDKPARVRPVHKVIECQIAVNKKHGISGRNRVDFLLEEKAFLEIPVSLERFRLAVGKDYASYIFYRFCIPARYGQSFPNPYEDIYIRNECRSSPVIFDRDVRDGSIHPCRKISSVFDRQEKPDVFDMNRGEFNAYGGVCGFAGCVSGDPRGFVGSVQKANLNHGNRRQGSREDDQPERKESNGIVRGPLPDGFAAATFGVFIVVFVGGLIVCGAFGLLSPGTQGDEPRDENDKRRSPKRLL